MDLLKTLVLYLAMIFATSVEAAPQPTAVPVITPEPTVVATATPVPTPTPTPVPTINITPNPAYKTLKVGDRGEAVRELQEKLIEYGYLEGEVDGAYGNQTRRAVEAFQYNHGLSADGIAGRRTLTVLYESNEVRPAPKADPTPAPTSEISVAITPEPSETPAPSDTPAAQAFTPVVTEAPTATAVPTATPVPELVPMTDYTVDLDNGQTLEATPCMAGTSVYLPVKELLEAAGIKVITSSSVESDEMAFAIGEDLIRLAYSQDRSGDPVQLQAYRGTKPQILPGRDIRRVEDSIYLPAETIEALTGMTVSVDDAAGKVLVSTPKTK